MYINAQPQTRIVNNTPFDIKHKELVYKHYLSNIPMYRNDV